MRESAPLLDQFGWSNQPLRGVDGMLKFLSASLASLVKRRRKNVVLKSAPMPSRIVIRHGQVALGGLEGNPPTAKVGRRQGDEARGVAVLGHFGGRASDTRATR